MKNIWAWSTKVAVVLLLVCVWHIFEQRKDNQQLHVDNNKLRFDLRETEQLLADEQEKNKALEKKTLEGLLKETNKAVIKGWESLLDSVEKELDKAGSGRSSEAEEGALDDMPDVYVPGERT